MVVYKLLVGSVSVLPALSGARLPPPLTRTIYQRSTIPVQQCTMSSGSYSSIHTHCLCVAGVLRWCDMRSPFRK